MLTMMHGARFVLFFMGCFGFYCGTIYNDLFSVPVNLFGSRWDGKGMNTASGLEARKAMWGAERHILTALIRPGS
eukprot:1390826-Amorphochlora_amoeboformis.AAC.1